VRAWWVGFLVHLLASVLQELSGMRRIYVVGGQLGTISSVVCVRAWWVRLLVHLLASVFQELR
jgi:hypothetical protein